MTNASTEVDDLLGMISDWGQDGVAFEDIVGVEIMFHVFSGLLGLVVGKTIAVSRVTLIPSMIFRLLGSPGAGE